VSQTPDDISTRIRATLSSTIPGLSCELGTPERKIIDACAEAISEAYIDQYLVGSLMDIDTKAGLELEQYVGIFGFGRLNGSPSTGVVRVVANVAPTTDYTFNQGSQFYSSPSAAGSGTTLYFFSTQAVVLVAGDTSCDIPVQCSIVGTAGNVPPDSIVYLGDTIGGSTVTNLAACVGGVDIETDSELRQRFKDTLLRNVAGTADWYEAICQQNNNISRVKVFGPISLYSTQIAVPSTTLTLPVNQDVKYAWPAMSSCFTNYGQEDEIYYSPINDYTYAGGASPTLTRITSGAMTTGDIVDFEFQYTTRSSRNDPVNSITNKVDVFVDGVDPVNVQEATVVSSSVLTATTSALLYTGKFQRIGSSGSPTAGNRFMRLGSTPVVSFPPTMTIGGVVYTQGTHYHLLQATTLLAGTQQEVSGIEWTGAGPSTGTAITVHYVYNRIPELINAIIAGAKQITTDVMVHQANYAYIEPCFQIEYDRAFTLSVVNSAIVGRLQTYFQGMPFGAPIKLSNLCMAVQQVQGVIDTKITTSSDDSVDYGVQIFANSTSPTPSLVETADFKLADNQIAVYQGVNINRVAAP
jgi:uncharacterized phage protein gp47/JayE